MTVNNSRPVLLLCSQKVKTGTFINWTYMWLFKKIKINIHSFAKYKKWTNWATSRHVNTVAHHHYWTLQNSDPHSDRNRQLCFHCSLLLSHHVSNSIPTEPKWVPCDLSLPVNGTACFWTLLLIRQWTTQCVTCHSDMRPCVVWDRTNHEHFNWNSIRARHFLSGVKSVSGVAVSQLDLGQVVCEN